MKILIAEDDIISRRIIEKFMSSYGECDLVIDGIEAIDAYILSIKENTPYDLICLDIMMPRVDGITVLKTIREIEKQNNLEEDNKVKIIMTTALSDSKYVQKAFEYGCEAYASKPIDIERLIEVMNKLNFFKKP